MDECVNIEYEEVLDESVEPITKHRRMSGDVGRFAKQASKSSPAYQNSQTKANYSCV